MSELIEMRNPAIHDLVAKDATADRVAAGFAFTEGPVWQHDSLLFSDVANNRIVRWRRLAEGPEVTTFATGRSAGLALDLSGSLLAAEHAGRRVSRVSIDGRRTPLVESYLGKRLNSPNDLVVKSDGAIYFTDPPYATSPGPGMNTFPRDVPEWWFEMIPGKELSVNGVYRLDGEGVLTLLAADFATPNGLAFSPDEAILYVDDSARRQLRAFDLLPDGTLANGRVLVDMTSPDPGPPDGMTVDYHGNIFCTAGGGIWVCRPSGEILGRLIVPEQPANVAWGEDGSTLFITARTSVFAVRTTTRGRIG